MSAKHFVSDSNTLIVSALKAQLALQPGTRLDQTYQVFFRSRNDDRVTLLSGGGSGHEPAHAGYVGAGMLDAAVCGALFASPNAAQVRRALELVASPRGSVVIVKNYTGDKLNFGLAIEQTRAMTETDIRMVIVGDDAAVPRSRSAMVGRRGLAGTVLVHKITAAAAADGLSIGDVASVAEYVASRMATIGASLQGCSVPGKADVRDLRIVPDDELELGMGIHNEPGCRRLSTAAGPGETISEMLTALLNRQDPERGFVNYSTSSPVVLLVNNLGGLSVLELSCLTHLVLEQLRETYKILPQRVFAGTFLSSLDSDGFSITLLFLQESLELACFNPDQMLRWLDAPTEAIGWSPAISTEAWKSISTTVQEEKRVSGKYFDTSLQSIRIKYDRELFQKVLCSVHHEIGRCEPEITRYDTIVGDGDCGTTLLTGAVALVNDLERGIYDSASLLDIVLAMSKTISYSMGGTSGALYGIFFSALAASLKAMCSEATSDSITNVQVATAATQALESLMNYTAARVGDRTMMDALIPFISAFHKSIVSGMGTLLALRAAYASCVNGYEATRGMTPAFGRSVYVQAAETLDNLTASSVPDPGALGIVAIIRGFIQAMEDDVPGRKESIVDSVQVN